MSIEIVAVRALVPAGMITVPLRAAKSSSETALPSDVVQSTDVGRSGRITFCEIVNDSCPPATFSSMVTSSTVNSARFAVTTALVGPQSTVRNSPWPRKPRSRPRTDEKQPVWDA